MKALMQSLELRADAFAHDWLPVLTRFVFASTLLLWLWRSALTKLGDGITGLWTPSINAWAQVFPQRFEAVGYDDSAMSLIERLIVIFGTWAEFILPALIAIGLMTRLSALAMIGFLAVLSFVDVTGHGVAPGALFDGDPAGIVSDQRLWWVIGLLALVGLGGGKLSVDRWLFGRR